MPTFWATFAKIWLLFMATSGHTAVACLLNDENEGTHLTDGKEGVVDVTDDGPAHQGQAGARHDPGHEISGDLENGRK